LRLAQVRDVAAIEDLLRARGQEAQQLELARLVLSDPRERVAVCATALIGLRETVLGFGTIEVGSSEPDLIVTNRDQADCLESLLARALLSRSATIAQRRAA
jgi:hypothetical protein